MSGQNFDNQDALAMRTPSDSVKTKKNMIQNGDRYIVNFGRCDKMKQLNEYFKKNHIEELNKVNVKMEIILVDRMFQMFGNIMELYI